MFAANAIQASIPGQQWVYISNPLSPDYAYICLFANGKFFVAGQNGYYSTSPDAKTWTSRLRHSLDWVFTAAYMPNVGKFVMPAGNTAYTSSDGVSWTAGGSLFSTSQFVRCMGYGNGVLLALGADALAQSPRLATSTNGSSWTDRGLLSSLISGWPTNVNIVRTFGTQNCAYGAGVFVVVATASSAAYCATSSDGVSWSDRSASLQSVLGAVVAVTFVVWSPSLNKFFVGATGGKLASSSDGVTWSSVTLPSGVVGSNDLVNMADVSGTLVLFVSDNTVLTSGNGVNWTRRPAFETLVPSTLVDASGVASNGSMLLTTATGSSSFLTLST
jgi:hypothetical protein